MQQQAAEFFLTSESVYFEPQFSRPARTRAVLETPSEARPSPVEETRPKKRRTPAAVKGGLSEASLPSAASPAEGNHAAKPSGIPRARATISEVKASSEARPLTPKLTPAPFFAIARDHSLARAKNGTKA